MKNDNYIMLPNGVVITREEYRNHMHDSSSGRC